MIFGGFLDSWRGRRQRVEALHALAAALNRLDYKAARALVAPSIVVTDTMGRRIEGVDAFVDSDSAFRKKANAPQIIITSASERDGEVFVAGDIVSDNPALAGRGLWRAAFDGKLISRLEITRPAEQMTVTKFHALQHA